MLKSNGQCAQRIVVGNYLSVNLPMEEAALEQSAIPSLLGMTESKRSAVVTHAALKEASEFALATLDPT